MAESLFSLEERLVLAFLLQNGPKAAAELAEAFAKHEGPDQMPVDLTSTAEVSELLEGLWYRDVVTPVRAPKNCDRYDLEPTVRELMRLGGTVTVGGLLGVLHG